MTKHQVKALDHYDSLLAGHTYELSRIKGSRMIRFEDVTPGVKHDAYSVYPWQLQDGIARGALILVDGTQSPAMSCTAATSLCKKLSSGFAY